MMQIKKPGKLLDFVKDLAGDDVLKVEKDLGSGYFRLNTAEAERRQAKHDIRSVEDIVVELVRNSRDANARSVYIATSKDKSGIRHLTIIDDGAGIPADFHDAIFEPRVTSKIDNVIEDRFGIHGRGMALYSIKSNVDDIQLVNSSAGKGCAISLKVATKILRERKDQSAFPKLSITAADRVKIISGPHNILRHLTEMTLEAPELEIFFGTSAEILMTIQSRAGMGGEPEPFWADLAGVGDAERLCRLAYETLGLSVSVRNCQRIAAGAIKPINSIKSRLGSVGPKAPVKIAKRAEVGGISKEDLESLAEKVLAEVASLGDKYLLKPRERPKIRCTRSSITINIEMENEEGW